MKIYELNDIFDFGKYKGKSIKEIMEYHSNYIAWCIEKVGYFAISRDAMRFFTEECYNECIELDSFMREKGKVRKKVSVAPEIIETNNNKLNMSEIETREHETKNSCFYYNSGNNEENVYLEEDEDYSLNTWDAMTDGMYGDMPDGFDDDYDFLG